MEWSEEAHQVPLFQQYNARPHVARVITSFLQNQGIQVMQCMPYSPHFNLIKRLWENTWFIDSLEDEATRKVNNVDPDLARRMKHDSNDHIRHFVCSTFTRCQVYVQALEGHTCYRGYYQFICLTIYCDFTLSLVHLTLVISPGFHMWLLFLHQFVLLTQCSLNFAEIVGLLCSRC